ncbi:hypothetical protein SAMN02745146_0092 [Hymenobacter daecheongensis DSM 21074]|uniref:Uncharacterized protein n=1 Tax=Hymenobacter daecheongensis DSM 21074 TaxID=1121955 RepID=A0A1M6LXE9_9BACT|nr:hypothetical protein [Hymenobacter daecheongensis]SHJ75894.1 hypothetical protein SAMN02745146_0092 [Hymenobacter daecheongensis DSM 21074]
MNRLLTNVTKGWLTSLIGVIIICAALASVFTKNISWGDAALGMAVGVTLLGMPNPTLPGTGVVGVLVLLLAFGGCATQKRFLDKYGTQGPAPTIAVTDSVRVPVAVSTPADSLSTSLDIDSLASAWSRDTVRLVSAGGRAEVAFVKSADGRRLETRVKVPPTIIHDTITTVVTLYGQCPPSYTLSPTYEPPLYVRWWEYFKLFSAVLVLLLLVIVGALRLLRPR